MKNFCIFFAFLSLCLHANENVNMETPPKYLYKILSYTNWQATQSQRVVQCPAEDAAFIHFSREDQLDRILTKYWSDQPSYAILKIVPEKMQGRLVFETNPGGTAKYYHLYEGSIPFNAIAEVKIVFRESESPSAPSKQSARTHEDRERSN